MDNVALILCNDMHMDIERANELLAYITKNSKYQISTDYTNANTIIIMTCAFGTGKDNSLRIIADVEKNAWKFAKIIITGCLLKTNYKELEEIIHDSTRAFKLMDFDDVKEFFKIGEETNKPLVKKMIPQNKVIISTGCLKRCSYCVYPQIANKYISKPMEDILAEVDELARIENTIYITGALETSDYGVDLYGVRKFHILMDKICSRHKDTNFVIGWFHPSGVIPAFLDVLEKHKNIVGIMVHIQHVDDGILKAMNRPSFDSTESCLWELKHVRPDIMISTEVIVGFPGETDEIFEGLVHYLELSKNLFDDIGVAAYEPVEGTVAAKLPNLPDYQVRMERMGYIFKHFDNVTMYPAPIESKATFAGAYYALSDNIFGIPKMIFTPEARQKYSYIAGTDSEYKDIPQFLSLMQDISHSIFNARDELAIKRVKETLKVNYVREFREYVYDLLLNSSIKDAMLQKAKKILLED